MFIVDAHLDLAYNATLGRDLTMRSDDQPPLEGCIASVSFPELREGNVRLVCATIFCEPSIDGKPGYRTADEAQVQAWEQMQYYLSQYKAGEIDLVTDRSDLPRLSAAPARALPAIILMEGADAIRTVDDVKLWHGLGVRIVGLAWKRTRFAGGTGAPGPLTPEGIELVRKLDEFSIIHDTSHLAEESFWQLLDIAKSAVMASHSNCREIVPTDRQLSDNMIRAIASRGGVIGINAYQKFLLPPTEHGKRRATLADIVRHVDHICQVTSSAYHVGIGTDMDGGLGREQIPVELRSSADLPRLAEALSTAGYNDADVARVMGENWLRFFERALPD